MSSELADQAPNSSGSLRVALIPLLIKLFHALNVEIEMFYKSDHLIRASNQITAMASKRTKHGASSIQASFYILRNAMF